MTSIMNMLILHVNMRIKVKKENKLKKAYQNILLSNITYLRKMEIAENTVNGVLKPQSVLASIKILMAGKDNGVSSRKKNLGVEIGFPRL